MSAVFSASDVVQFAVRIEENGAAFYRHAVQTADNKDARTMFSQMAEDQATHRWTFQTTI